MLSRVHDVTVTHEHHKPQIEDLLTFAAAAGEPLLLAHWPNDYCLDGNRSTFLVRRDQTMHGGIFISQEEVFGKRRVQFK